MEINVIDKRNSFKPIEYGDGFRRVDYTFDRDVTKEEFIEFCKKEGHTLHLAEGWWDDHSKIEGDKNKWSYIWVLAYDD